jgi:hypothetical protein
MTEIPMEEPENHEKHGLPRVKRAKKPDHQRGAWGEDFLRWYEETGDLTVAREAAGIGRTALYDWRDENEAFARRMREIREVWIDRLAAVCQKRAITGVVKKVHRPVRKITMRSGDEEEVRIEYAEEEVREFSFARERWWLERMRPEEFAPTPSGDVSAVEFASRIHAALEQMDGSMDEDEPADVNEDEPADVNEDEPADVNEDEPADVE